MAAVLGRKLRDEARLPQRLEAVHRVERGKARIFGVDEDEPVLPVDGELVGVDVAGGLRHARHVEPLVVEGLMVGELALTEHVLEPPDLGDGGEIEALRGGAR
jgi:hypothetical protein